MVSGTLSVVTVSMVSFRSCLMVSTSLTGVSTISSSWIWRISLACRESRRLWTASMASDNVGYGSLNGSIDHPIKCCLLFARSLYYESSVCDRKGSDMACLEPGLWSGQYRFWPVDTAQIEMQVVCGFFWGPNRWANQKPAFRMLSSNFFGFATHGGSNILVRNGKYCSCSCRMYIHHWTPSPAVRPEMSKNS